MKSAMRKARAAVAACILVAVAAGLGWLLSGRPDAPELAAAPAGGDPQVSSAARPQKEPVLGSDGDTEALDELTVQLIEATTVMMDPADWIAAERTAAIIARLEAESLEQAFENASYGMDYHYPGFYGGTTTGFHETRMILSNRRFARLYAALQELPPDEQYDLLSKYFNQFLLQYRDILSRFEIGVPARPEDDGLLSRVSQSEGQRPGAPGIRHALQSMALLSALLGNESMWPSIKAAIAEPVAGAPLDKDRFTTDVYRAFTLSPVFSDAMRAQVSFLMADNADPDRAAAVGLDTRAVLAAAEGDSLTRVMELFDYRSEVTAYDVLARMGDADLDRSHGVWSITFLVKDRRQVLDAVIAAGR